MHRSHISHGAPLGRRELLRGGAGLAGALALTSPSARAARGMLAGSNGRTAVVIQLTGGNDGLSTVVPHADDAYGAARKATRIKSGEALRLDDYRGLHPGLERFRRLYDAGHVAIVEGVGYAGAPRSHFKSLEVWHTARGSGRASGEGWIGRLGATPAARAESVGHVVHLGGNAPYSVYSVSRPPVSLESPTGYKWFGSSNEAAAYRMAGERLAEECPADGEAARRNSGRDASLARLRGLLDDANDSSARIRGAIARYATPVSYPRTPFGANLHDVAALIHGGLGTRVFSTGLTGFDTHANQKNKHDGLMRTLDGGLSAFLNDLGRSEVGRDTVVLVFSEFGRRVQENASNGTDHGKAGPMFVLGHRVNGGLHGRHPSLTGLDKGDLEFTTDFRSVYAALVEDWLGCDSEAVLGARYERLPLFGT